LLLLPTLGAAIARGFISKESASGLTQNGFGWSIGSSMVAHGNEYDTDTDTDNGEEDEDEEYEDEEYESTRQK
jgi:hypothetical protein